MATFRIHRMKPTAREQFRWAPHTSGVSTLKAKDFEPAGEIQAASAYEAWSQLRGSAQALEVGDVLESEAGELRICKYVGFEEARWYVPEALLPANVAASAAAAAAEMTRPQA